MSEYIVEISKKGDFGGFDATSHGQLTRCRECQFFEEFGASGASGNKTGACSNKAGLINSIVFRFDFCSNALPSASKQEANK